MPDENPSSSVFLVVLVNVIYAVISTGLTFVNKALYRNYGFESPLALLLLQCFCNVVICSCFIIYKGFVPSAFGSLEKADMKINSFPEILSKWRVGLILGGSNLVNVGFGIYSLKYVSIPLFVTFRRCTMLTTMICMYLIQGQVPDRRSYFKIFLVCLGAIIAGVDTFNRDMFGYFLIWMNNFSQSGANVLINKFNRNKSVNSFEITFFYGMIGLVAMSAYCLYTGEVYELTNALSS